MSLLDEPGPIVRPPGIRILGFGGFALAAYLALNGILVQLGLVSFTSGAYLLGGLEVMGPLIYWIIAAALVGLGFSLLRGWRWSRRLCLIAAALLIAGSVMPVSAAVVYSQVIAMILHGVKIILAIVIIRYLFQPEVADWFAIPKKD